MSAYSTRKERTSTRQTGSKWAYRSGCCPQQSADEAGHWSPATWPIVAWIGKWLGARLGWSAIQLGWRVLHSARVAFNSALKTSVDKVSKPAAVIVGAIANNRFSSVRLTGLSVRKSKKSTTSANCRSVSARIFDTKSCSMFVSKGKLRKSEVGMAHAIKD